MTVHLAWAAVEWLLDNGWVITDPGPGQPRTATLGEITQQLEPRCECDYCPQPNHPNYRHVEIGAAA